LLDCNPALDNTCGLLKSAGFPEQTVNEFKHLVQYHNRDGNRVDVRKFPPPQDCYYQFDGIGDLTNRTVCYFDSTPGNGKIEQKTLVCYDVACLLLSGASAGAPRLYENFPTNSILAVSREREVSPAMLETFRKGTGSLSSLESYRYLVGRPRGEAETQLGLALTAARKLPPGATDSDESLRAIHAELVRLLKADGFKFPTNCQVGLVYYIDVKRGFILADHAFICIPVGGRLVIVEKNSAAGPYVRADFGTEEDLANYSSLAERRDTSNPKDCDFGSSVVVALNERVIGMFRSEVTHRGSGNAP
jgi:hypothetical protein